MARRVGAAAGSPRQRAVWRSACRPCLTPSASASRRPPRLASPPPLYHHLNPQYVLPTDSPHLAKSLMAQALSPVLWAQHKPDRFDTWSAGITMMCLVVPSLRTPRAETGPSWRGECTS